MLKYDEDKKIVNDRFVKVTRELLDKGRIKTQGELADILEEYPTVLSQIKKGKKNVTIPQMVKFINEFNLNANYFLRKNNSNEEIEYNMTINSGNINVENNNVSGTGIVNGDVYNAESIVHNASPEVQGFINELRNENTQIRTELLELKKMTDFLLSQVKDANEQVKVKDERLFELQKELFAIYRETKK